MKETRADSWREDMVSLYTTSLTRNSILYQQGWSILRTSQSGGIGTNFMVVYLALVDWVK